MASDPTDLIHEATEAVYGFVGWEYSPDNVDTDPADPDSYYDVDGPFGGYVARCDYPETAQFIAAAPDLMRRLRDALEASEAEREKANKATVGAIRMATDRTDERDAVLALLDRERAALAEANATIERAQAVIESPAFWGHGTLVKAAIRRAIEGPQS